MHIKKMHEENIETTKEKPDDLSKELDLSKDIKVSDDFDSSLHELKFSCSECTARFSSEFPKSGYPSLFLADIVWPK